MRNKIGLSEPVQKSVHQAVKIVQMLVDKLEGEQHERIMESTLDNSGDSDLRGDPARSETLHQDQHDVVS